MRGCKRCIQPDTRPNIYFSDEGLCGACVWEDEKKLIDWNKREAELYDIAKWAKQTTTSKYDCVIGVSGGKDSTKQSISPPNSVNNLDREKIKNEFRNKCFSVVTSTGFDDYYLLRSSGLDTDDDEELSFKENATTRSMATAFSKHAGKKITSRVVLNRFIDLIS